MGKYIKPHLLEKAKSIDLVTYFRTYMPSELVRASTNEYTTKSHDSLRMSNGLWNWCSRGFGGKNAIDFNENEKYAFYRCRKFTTRSNEFKATYCNR